MKRVLLPVYTAGHFTELIRIARLLKASARYSPTFWFWKGYYSDFSRERATCAQEGFPLVEEGAVSSQPAGDSRRPTTQSRLRGALSAFARTVLSGLPFFPVAAVRAIARQGLELSRCRTLVANQQVDLLVLAEDSVGYQTAALIKAAHERQAPSAIVPFTVCNALEPAEAYFRDPAYGLERWENRLVATLFPKWVYSHRGRLMVRLPAPQLLAKEFYRLSPPLPWQMNSGSADAIAVESEFMRAYYEHEGLPRQQLVVTGMVADDLLAGNLRNHVAQRERLCAELGLPHDRRLILCALPPDHFVIAGPQADVPDYESLVRTWMQTLAAVPNAAVVVRLHPRTSYDDLKYIEQWGVKISQRDTAELVPLCDLFVASVSATIRWAIACGRPVLNYDVYHLRWTDFDDAPGVLRVEDQHAFAAMLQKLATDAAFFDGLRAQQQADAGRWGQLDGRAGERIVNCFDQLVNRRGR